ncbi:hypothetical protein [Maribacter sp. Asnod2-G09]|uniref:hypothetical protein n=1 Tax=Maribacter sp. Asnod2-G09 TaxID=3160577 RepID=UPI00386DD42A
MPKKLTEIERVWRFICGSSQNGFYYINSNKHLCQWKKNKSITIIDSFKCEIVEPWADGLLINENTLYSGSKIQKLFEGEIYSKSIIDNNSLLVRELDFINEKVGYGVFDKTTSLINKIKTPSNIRPLHYLNENRIISQSESDLYCHSIDGDIIWNRAFKELINSSKGTITKPLIKVGYSYFIGIGENKSDHLFNIDLESGKCDELKYFQFEFFFNNQEQLITSQHQNTLLKLNLRTKEQEVWDVDELIKTAGFESVHDQRCQFDKNTFYFTQTLGDDRAKVGFLDTKIKELTFSHKFQPNNGGISTIEQNENQIFVCTQDNILHIFEK